MKVRVFKKGEVGVDENELDQLLAEAGCVQVDEDKPAPGDGADDQEDEEHQRSDAGDNDTEVNDEEDDVTLIVVLTPECADDPQLEGAVGSAVGSGGRAVGVWPKGAEERTLPSILGKIGSGAVVWDSKKLAAVLSDEESTWDTPAGEPRVAPKTKRNKC
ncbi:hypothetical protein LGR54_00670 [Ancylobacter sp. Lp-2]|uniref:hypothetical protein n=1 Tax=Ancylobacter sp. Lp-2 TaxID=2881339 RepID=UPI001E5EE7E7|nr:hypothetical protein [Ancylobacter sp. Lp-2]MCB4767106.1 hypothetical protein [Ancylobacter sp. Lp-2]